ncbi:T9SS type A sorting domain-containing protein [Hymenobacter elongatus]|uniref:T9SS type A sorting domain-containing protein n=1 Tax=Hymenobacter elongatus TaxID=877208 RepID=UPI001436ABA8|nr:T9SS type A sorting domain-containing protein [Hymenobacter elongatus]
MAQTVPVNAGTYNFGVFAQAGGWNIHWIRITKASSTRLAAPAASTATAATGQELELYPTPATTQISFQSELDLSGSHYQILDGRGQMVASGVTHAGLLNVAALKTGLYILVVTTKDSQKLTRRFSK